MIRLALLAAAVPLLAGAADTGPETLADAQCMTALALVASDKESGEAATAQVAMMYYMGRLDVRVPQAELRALLFKVAADLKPDGVGPTLRRCGALLQQRGAAYQEIGQAMVAAGK